MTGVREKVDEAMREIPPPPCEVHACAQSRRCALERLACDAFTQYVRYGRWTATAARKPTRAAFRLVFTGGAS